MNPHIKKDNGRLDVKSLRKRYKNAAMQEQYINEAKRTLKSMTYRNERVMKFETFVDKFVKAVDNLERFDRVMHNTDIVGLILKKMSNHDLSQYITSLKVQFQR